MQVMAEDCSMTLEMPKSPIFREKFLVRKMLADLRSRCRMFLEWSTLMPKSSWVNQ